MISHSTFAATIARANLAPSVHNIQPARWRLEDDQIIVAADLAAGLSIGDPEGRDAGLSCGAAIEATILALGDLDLGAEVEDHWELNDQKRWPGHRIAAVLTLRDGVADPLAAQLEERFTWRAAFQDETAPLLHTSDDMHAFISQADKSWIAQRNDWASLQIMRDKKFRNELVSWMRLRPDHPRYRFDGLSREALQMPAPIARLVQLALGPLWPALDLVGAARSFTSEAKLTQSAALIAAFHVPVDASQTTAGRAYLRLCLKAAAKGYAGWPMAALTDHPTTKAEITQRIGLPATRRLVQVLRFGRPAGAQPPRARRPIEELVR